MSESLGLFTQQSNKEGEDKPSEHQQALQQTLEHLFSDENMVFKADLSKANKFWFHMARAKTIADAYQLDSVNAFHKTIMQHSVSISRKGRKEFIQLWQTLNESRDDEDLEKEARKRSLFG